MSITLKNKIDEIIHDKNGVEIGGPSLRTGDIIYNTVNNIDIVVFSNSTVWFKHTNKYNFADNKYGNVIINDTVDITNVPDNHYDFVFSSHALEHIANPLKAVKEWLRIVNNGGYIIIIVPEKSFCFDHKRNYTNFSTLLNQYNNNVNEDDLSTLDEILNNHDLSLDPDAGTFEQFKNRSLDNINNRCLHHYVYNDALLFDICNFFNCDFIYNETINIDRWFIMKKK